MKTPHCDFLCLIAGLIFLAAGSLLSAAPTISSFTPTSVRPGATITVTGTGFTGATGTPLRINGSGDGSGGLAVAVSVVDDTSLTATLPLGAVSGRLSLTVAGQTGLSGGTLSIAPDWQLRNPSLTADTLNGIALGDDGAGNAVYVAAGSAGDIITSVSGVNNWTMTYTSRTAVSANSFFAATFASTPHKFVVVGNAGRFMSSTDGSTWTQGGPGGSSNFRGVAYGNGTFVAVSQATTVATSTDGVTWGTNINGSATTTNALAFGNGLFVSVGNTGVIRTSPDGVTWTAQTSGTTNTLNGIAWCNDRFIAVGANSALLTSPDGITWTVRSVPNATTNLLAASYGNGVYLATSTQTSFRSADGVSWTASGNNNFDGRGVLFDGSQFVAAGAGASISTGVDGLNWTLRKSISKLNYTDAIYGGGLFVAVSSSGNSTYAFSPDGVSWSAHQIIPNGNQAFNDVAFGNGQFVAVGNNNLYATGAFEIGSDPDDADWSNNVPGGSPNLQAVAFGNGTFVAVGNAGVAFSSTGDEAGYQWSAVISGTGNNLLGVAYGASGFVAVGANGTIITSPDGTTWTTRTSGTANQLNGVSFSGTQYVAVGASSTVLTSPNGVTWTARTLTAGKNLMDVAYGDGLYVITNLTDTTSLYFSTDAINWVQSNLTGHLLNANTVAGIGFGNGRFTVVSSNGQIISSNLASDTLGITAQPANQTITSGNPATFTVTANGTGLQYQWYQEPLVGHLYTTTVPVGTNSASYTTPNLTQTEVYWVRVTDASGTTVDSRSAPAFSSPRIIDWSANQSVAGGSNVTLDVFTIGSGTITYQWQKDGVNIPGATGATLTLTNVQAGDAGSYTVIASNGNGSPATSPAAVLTVTNQAPLFIGTVGGTTTLAAEGQTYKPFNGHVVQTINNVATSVPAITGSGPLTYQWKKNGVDVTNGGSISGADTATITFTNMLTSDAGDYTLYVSNSYGNATSGVFTVKVANAARPYAFTTLAGLANKGSTDDTGTAARFASPQNMTISGTTLYIADTSNHVIRMLDTTTGAVTTLAGLAGFSGTADGTGSAARFNNPGGVAVDGAGNVYVNDSFSATIRKITPGGVVTTLAGSPGLFGSADGIGSAARFNRMVAIVLDGAGYLYVTDSSYGTIRRINSTTGEVTTFAGLAGQRFYADGTGGDARFTTPSGLTRDPITGDLYLTDTSINTVRKITPAGVVTTIAGSPNNAGYADGTGGVARFRTSFGIAADASGNLYVVDSGNHVIRKITAGGVVTTLAGTGGVSGSADGTGAAARFSNPSGAAVDAAGNVYVSDNGNSTIRLVTPAGVVTTVAGTPPAVTFDGTGTGARFNGPNDVTVDSAGNAYVADSVNHTIRMITPAGVTTTLAGQAGVSGSTNAVGTAARFSSPNGIAVDPTGILYVADTGNHLIRKIATDGTVTTLAGSAGSTGNLSGIGAAARFNTPRGVALGHDGDLFVADTGNHVIKRINLSNAQVDYWAGSSQTPNGSSGFVDAASNQALTARFNNPWKIAVDESGNIWVADRSNSRLRKIASNGMVSSPLAFPGLVLGVAADTLGNVYVSSAASVWKYRSATNEVDLLGGGVATNATGSDDGTGAAAHWFQTEGLAVNAGGRLYVSDSSGSTIRSGISIPALTFPAITGRSFGDMPFRLGATTTNGLLVRGYTVTSGPAVAQERGLVLTGAGSVTLRAFQEGNDTYYLEQTFTAGAYNPGSIITGTWSKGDTTTDGSSVTLFMPNGYYYHIANANAAQVTAGGADGFEIGTYSWNSSTGSFSVTTLTDNNGNLGLSGMSGVSGLTATVAGGSLAISNIPVVGTDTFTAVASASPIVGGWVFGDASVVDDRTGVVFLPNGYYFMLGDNSQADPSNIDGMEHGTYTWNSGTGASTIPTTLADTNGDNGLAGGSAFTPTVTISGDRITMHVVDTEDDTDIYLTRVGAPGTAPAITTHPLTQTVGTGDSVTLTVVATGTPVPSYQWKKGPTDIPGATGASLPLSNFQAGDADSYTVVVTNVIGSATSNAAVLTLGASGFTAWRQSKFTVGEQGDVNISGPNAVFGQDGLTNLVKYALGLEPKQNITTGLPEVSTTATDWVYSYTRPASITDVTYTVEVSTNLTTWTTAGVTHELVSTTSGIETWRARYPLASGANVFFRLKVTQP